MVYHVVPYKDKQWAVKSATGKKIFSIHDSKLDAIDTARKQRGETVVHSPTGAALQPIIISDVDINAIREAVRKVGDHKSGRLVFKRSRKTKQAKKAR